MSSPRRQVEGHRPAVARRSSSDHREFVILDPGGCYNGSWGSRRAVTVDPWRSRFARLSLGFAVAFAGLLFSAQETSAQSAPSTVTATPNGDVSSGTIFGGLSCIGVFIGSVWVVGESDVGRSEREHGGSRPDDRCHHHLEPEGLRGNAPYKTVDCVKIGSKISSTMSQKRRPGPSGGTDHFSYVVPSGGTGGNQICDRAIVSGPWLNTEKGVILCYTSWVSRRPRFPSH